MNHENKIASEQIALLEEKIAKLNEELSAIKELLPENKITLIVSTQDLDKALSAFIIAAGAASVGMQVVMFFTFWGVNIIKKQRILSKKTFSEKMMSLMMPTSNKTLTLSKFNMFGLGSLFLKQVMKEHNVASLEDLININKELGVQLVSCQMSMGIMGISPEELVPGITFSGAGKCVGDAASSKFTLFI